MDALDDMTTYGAVALLLWLSALVFRDFRGQVSGKMGAFSALASAAYLLGSKDDLIIFDIPAQIIVLPLASVSAVAAWLFCLTLFDDHFRLALIHKMVFAVKLAAGLSVYVATLLDQPDLRPYLVFVNRAIIFAVTVHLVVAVRRGRTDDLVEERRQFRSVFTVSIIVASLLVLVVESPLLADINLTFLEPVPGLAFGAIAVLLLWRLSLPGGGQLFFFVPEKRAKPQTSHSHCDLSATDQHDLGVIEAWAAQDDIHEAGLTIAKLSGMLKIPEHRVRHLINQHMGYRNFADFLNHHRIERAKNRLADIADRNTPVLTVAMDLGYGSLGPFNRAFKERTGLTPTEFRNQSLKDGLASMK